MWPLFGSPTHLSTLILVAALTLPFVGSLLDHHFAERQAGHLHLSPPRHHVHAYGQDHDHGPASDNGSAAVYNYDSGLAKAVVVPAEDSALQSLRRFQPASIFTLPALSRLRVKQNYVPPPEKPPQPVL